MNPNKPSPRTFRDVLPPVDELIEDALAERVVLRLWEDQPGKFLELVNAKLRSHGSNWSLELRYRPQGEDPTPPQIRRPGEARSFG